LGLIGEEIPIPSRIITLVDDFGAITEDRIYRAKRSFEEAIIEFKRCSGSNFGPNVVNAFQNIVEREAVS